MTNRRPSLDEARTHIRFQRPQLPPVAEIARYFAAAEAERWYSNGGPCHDELTRRLEAYLGQGLHCVPLANATLALAVAARALVPRSSPRTEVILPSFTFAATAGAVVWAGLRPVFVDVDPHHWHVTAEAIRTAAGPDTALILACSTFGSPPPRDVADGWMAVGADLGVPVLVDSAAGFGSTSAEGGVLGGQGDAEVFSFHATKPFGIGEGGLLVAKDRALVDRASRLANFGFDAGVVTHDAGLNAKLAEWPAATALAVLDRFDTILERRRAAAEALSAAANGLGFASQVCPGRPAWQAVPVLAPSRPVRDAVVAVAAADDIEVRTYFDVPLHEMPAFRPARTAGTLDVTRDLATRMLSLPLANDQSASDRARIVAALQRAVDVPGG